MTGLDSNQYLINTVSELTGLSARTIRYYEEIQLISPPERSSSGYRIFHQADIRKLRLIRKARILDMPLKEIREIITLAFEKNCHSFEKRFLELLESRKTEVEKTIQELEELKNQLEETQEYLAKHRAEFTESCNAGECEKCAYIDE